MIYHINTNVYIDINIFDKRQINVMRIESFPITSTDTLKKLSNTHTHTQALERNNFKVIWF